MLAEKQYEDSWPAVVVKLQARITKLEAVAEATMDYLRGWSEEKSRKLYEAIDALREDDVG